jgi:dihydrofolate reductase
MPSGSETAPSSNMLPVELTLIVAATRNMGIGQAGTLPWTGLKKEMAYFARVTKRVDPMPSDNDESTASSQSQVNSEIN